MVVHNCGKLVRRDAVVPVNDEVFCGNRTRTVNRIIKPDNLPVGAETPGQRTVVAVACGGFLAGMWGLCDEREFAPTCGRGINEIGGAKFFERGGIGIAALTLKNRLAVPIETEPMQISDGLLDVTRFDAHPVEIVDPQHDAPAGCAR